MNTPGAMVGMTGGAVGAPVGNQVGGHPAANANATHEQLNTYIYDHLCRLKLYELARQFVSQCPIKVDPKPKKEMNGDDGMDMDSKDDIKRPDDLPIPNIGGHYSENSFLFDWWCQFWDIFGTARGKASNPVSQHYLQHNINQMKARNQSQQSLMGVNANVINRPQQFANMQTNGMNNMQKQAIANRGGMQAMMANKMQQNNMQDGDRPQSPGSMGNAPSPSKRPRLDEANGNTNGQPFPAGRGQPMPGNQMGNMPGGPNGMIMQNGMPADMNNFIAQNGQPKMDMTGAPQGMEGNASQGNHALQDYQMQLMLLEQQNKKRLLMARQEQDNINHVPGTSQPGQIHFAGAPQGMSPSNGRPGPSPNPNDQIKRMATPKMGPGNMPGSPAMAGDGNRGSPMPGGFDQNGMPSQMRQQMFAATQQSMMQGQAPSSHPNFPQMQMANMPQNIEQMRMAQQQGRMPNGQPWPQGGQPMMQTPSQQGQIGTPQQRNNMPPPPAPNTEQRTQPSSPAPTAGGPPTPSQAPKANPKGKKENAKKNAPQKAAAKKDAATPAATDAPAAAPAPSTPITPMHPANVNNNNNFQNKSGANAAAGGPPAQQQPAPQPVQNLEADFGLPPSNADFDLSFSDGGPDVLENFDFDTFLHNTEDNAALGFDFMQFTSLDAEASAGS